MVVMLLLISGSTLPATADEWVGHKDVLEDLSSQSLNAVFRMYSKNAWPPSSDKSIFLVMRSDGRTLTVVALSKPGMPPKRLALLLRHAATATILSKGNEQWLTSDKQTLAVRWVHLSHTWQTSSKINFPFGEFIDRIKSAGYRPKVMLSLPLTKRSLTKAAYVDSGFAVYDLSSATPRLRIALPVSVPNRTAICVFAAFILFLPLASVFGTVVAHAIWRWCPWKRSIRRRLFLGFGIVLPVLAAIISYASEFFYTRSPIFEPVRDLWLGGGMVGIINLGTIIPLSIGSVGILTVVSVQIYRELFRGDGTVGDVTIPDAEIRILRRITLNWVLIVVVVMPTVFLIGASSLSAIALSVPLLFLANSLIPIYLNYKSRVNLVIHENLTLRTKELAKVIQVRPANVKVADKVENLALYSELNAEAQNADTIIVTERLCNELTPDELDFVVAHELAHMKQKDTLTTRFRLLLVLPLLAIVQLTIINENRVFAAEVCAVLFVIATLSSISNRRERAADAEALQVTRNLSAAESVVIKLMQETESKRIQRERTGKVPRRIKLLRKAAQQIGL